MRRRRRWRGGKTGGEGGGGEKLEETVEGLFLTLRVMCFEGDAPSSISVLMP